MALTVMRRKVKLKTLAKKYKQHGLLITSLGCALLTRARLRRLGIVFVLVGASMYVKTVLIIHSLPNPYAFRHMYDYGRRSLDSFDGDVYHDDFRFPKASVIAHLNFFTRIAQFPFVVEIPFQTMYKGRPVQKRHVFNIDEIYLMFLNYLSTPVRQLDVAVKFGRTIPEVSRAITWFHKKLFPISKFYLQNEDQAWFDYEIASQCAESTLKKGCPVAPCLGFVDGVNKRIAKPSVSWLQTATYNGHKKHNGLVWAGCVVANGMCLLLLGPSPGRRHDAAVAAEHDLYEKLETLSTFPQHQFRGCFGGDSAYPVYWPIIPLHGPALTQQQVVWNEQMSSCRVTVEWLFGQQIMQFSSLDWMIRCKVLASPVKEAYLNACFLTNLLNTRYPNIISQYFECSPPCLGWK